MAPQSWSVHREVGLYFNDLREFGLAAEHLEQAARLFPGDRRIYLAFTADAAIAAGHFDRTIQMLEPFLMGCAPETDDLDAILVSQLARALQGKGDASRALEVVNRLPLRRRNLDQPLLFGLCVRALAKLALGQKADAKRDADRVYAVDPTFCMLAEVEQALAA